jgi:phosphoserine phosphatase RsbU/P
MLRNRGIATRLILLVFASIAAIFSLIFSYNYLFSRKIIVEGMENNARNLALATVNRIDSVLLSVEKVPQSLACFLENSSYDGSTLLELIRAMIENNPEIYGATVAFEPYAYSENSAVFAPYFWRNQGRVEFTHIPYDYFSWDWYQIPRELKRPAWSEPYFDEGAGGIIMATYSVPFYRRNSSGERELLGVVTADISLAWLQELVASIKIAQSGYGFLLSKNGNFVTHPDSNLIMNETIFSVAEAGKDARMRQLGREMINGGSGFVPFRSLMTGKQCWMVYVPLSSNGWSLGVLFPQGELMANILRLNRTVVAIGLAGLLIILLIIVLIAGSITRPIRALSKATEHMATGDLDTELPPVESRDEVGRLADSFESMKRSLKQHIAELTETTAAKERIESDLRIAHDIQMGILPKTFPPFPDRPEFDIYATLVPAREVGGDLYDFFFLDDDHLCFTIGDVSGKGVPAALFMAVTRTLIKVKATQGLTASTILSRVNEDLCVDNTSVMFVTLFLGILDIRTGELEYCNGGHNPPYIIHLNGDATPLELTKGVALGLVDKFSYVAKKVVLARGDTLFLYTDGVTEAMDRQGELFSEIRLRGQLALLCQKPVDQVATGVLDGISAFTHGMPQTDDIAIMVLRFNAQSQAALS